MTELCTEIQGSAGTLHEDAVSVKVTPLAAVFYYSTTEQLEDAEHWFGPFSSRAIAEDRCFVRFPDVAGCWTAEGCAQRHRLDPVTADMVQPGGAIAEAFSQANDEQIGDGGERGPWEWTNEAVASLVLRLNATFATWAEERGYERGWTLDIRHEQWTSMPHPSFQRDRPLLSLAGGAR